MDLNPRVKVLKHQLKFMMAQDRYVAITGGFGCGKSFGIGLKLYNLATINAGFDGMLVSRSGDQLQKLTIEVEKVFSLMGMTYLELKKFTGEANTYTTYGSRQYIMGWGNCTSTIYMNTTENQAYKRWAGGNMAFVLIDEIDTMPHAETVWAFANDRVRVKAPLLQTACASTPEGYGFLWDFFENKPLKDELARADRQLIRGCTFDNPHLDPSYVRGQIMTRDPASMKAYLYGEFVNLDGTLVYYRFDRNQHVTNLQLKDFPDHVVHIGVDFNKNINAASLNVVRDGNVFCVDECYGATDVEALIAQIRSKCAGRVVKIYPDASGYEGIRQLERAFGEGSVIYNPANPLVKIRVASVNERLSTKEGMARVFINAEKAPHVFNGLMRQVKDAKGEPDKTKGLDHALDGFGYFIYQCWPAEDQGGTISFLNSRPKYTMSMRH